MSSSIQMKEGMGEATINKQPQGMIIKVVGAVAVAHLLNDLIQAVLPAIYPMLKTNFSLSFAQVGLISLVNVQKKQKKWYSGKKKRHTFKFQLSMH